MSFFKWYDHKKEKRVRETASHLFQLTEYDGSIWLTYNGCLVCPCSMLKDAPVNALQQMRDCYINRNAGQEDKGVDTAV